MKPYKIAPVGIYRVLSTERGDRVYKQGKEGKYIATLGNVVRRVENEAVGCEKGFAKAGLEGRRKTDA